MYCQGQIRDRRYPLRCPYHGCSHELSSDIVRSVLAKGEQTDAMMAILDEVSEWISRTPAPCQSRCNGCLCNNAWLSVQRPQRIIQTLQRLSHMATLTAIMYTFLDLVMLPCHYNTKPSCLTHPA